MIRWILAIAACSVFSAHAQTQVDLTHQVRNALGYASGGTNAMGQIAARANVGTPKLVATDFSGADIGVQISSAFSSFGAGKCGTVMIPQGTYTYSGGPIFIPTGCTLEGVGHSLPEADGAIQGTELVYAGPAATSAIVLGSDSSYNPGPDAQLQNVLIRSNAGVCPNDGMLRWNASAFGANKWQCGALGTSQTVSNATNASPIAITVIAHGYSTGNRVSLSGVQGNTAANGEWTITVTDANTFTLNGSTGNNNFIAGVGTPAAAQLVTYSTAVPHLSAIQHGQIDPTALVDGAHETVDHVRIDAGVGSGNIEIQGRFHFGVYLNGCEECVVEDTHVEGADDGFAIGPATNSILIQPTARTNRRSGIHLRGISSVTLYSPLMESNEWFGHIGAAGYGFGLLGDTENTGTPGIQGRIFSAYYENNPGADVALGVPNGYFSGSIQAVGTKVNRGVIATGVTGYFADAILNGCNILNGALVHVAPGTSLTHDCLISSGSIDNSQGNARVYQMVEGRLVYADNGQGQVWNWATDANAGGPMTFYGGTSIVNDNLANATAGNPAIPSAVAVFSGKGWASGPAQSQRLNFSLMVNPQGGTSQASGSLDVRAKVNARDTGDLGPTVMSILPDGTLEPVIFAAKHSSPATTVAAAAGAGATCTLVPSVGGAVSDMAGKVRLVTGTGGWSAGTQCTVTFASSSLSGYTSLVPSNASAAAAFSGRQVYVDSSTTGFTINFGIADAAQTTYEFIWHAIGNW